MASIRILKAKNYLNSHGIINIDEITLKNAKIYRKNGYACHSFVKSESGTLLEAKSLFPCRECPFDANSDNREKECIFSTRKFTLSIPQDCKARDFKSKFVDETIKYIEIVLGVEQ